MRCAPTDSAFLSVQAAIAEEMNTARDFVVVDVETSGFDPAAARVLSVAALTITADGSIENSMYTLLNPGVDPGPTNIHGLTPAMLAGQPCYADIAEHLAPLLRGRILVAHDAAFGTLPGRRSSPLDDPPRRHALADARSLPLAGHRHR